MGLLGLFMLGLTIGGLFVGLWFYRYRLRARERIHELEDGQYHYRSLYEHNKDVIVELDLKGRILGMNPQAEQMRVLSMERLRNNSFSELIREDCREQAKSAYLAAVSGCSSGLQLYTVAIINEPTCWDVTFLPIVIRNRVAGVFGIGINRTAEKKLEAQLAEQEHSYRLIAESMTDIVIVCDTSGVPSYISPSFTKLTGYSIVDSLYRRPVFIYFESDVAAEMEASFQYLLANKHSTRFSFLLYHADGSPIWLESVSTAVLAEDGRVDRIVIVLRNISGRKRAEQRLKQNEELYLSLQSSLDAFSKDASSLNHRAELEQRLVRELREVLGTPQVSLLETEGFSTFIAAAGSRPGEEALHAIAAYRGVRLPLGEMIETAFGLFFLVGEARGRTLLVWLDGEPAEKLSEAPVRIWVKTLSRYASVFIDNQLKIQDLTAELEHSIRSRQIPAWFMRMIYKLTEQERMRLSQELHDSALQEQIIWYRRLEMLSSQSSFPEEARGDLQQITEGLLDVIHQIRVTCHELRPPFLKEWGIIQALEDLFSRIQLRADFAIAFQHASFHTVLSDDHLIAIYRITQELLSNAYKHSQATQVNITLSDEEEGVLLVYTDNGIGLTAGQLQGSLRSLGLLGIHERVRSLEGEIRMQSTPGEGLSVRIYLPRFMTDESLFRLNNTDAGEIYVEYTSGR
ncbi:hypothetical protein DCC85_18910 [Paenibacillus sp. CAA11]|uniref:sensor histidine kinase n=1 Tax=Paenibacillus sp. CAA11 TaxID=1532905 RepID=UPI000D39A9BD|nr:PAS domain S-box protein [Paenibacillus sp. CAA11]AWB46036.1 hypothetical protein DCC85_18910 [Paenibacillus sp. CAA11]